MEVSGCCFLKILNKEYPSPGWSMMHSLGLGLALGGGFIRRRFIKGSPQAVKRGTIFFHDVYLMWNSELRKRGGTRVRMCCTRGRVSTPSDVSGPHPSPFLPTFLSSGLSSRFQSPSFFPDSFLIPSVPSFILTASEPGKFQLCLDTAGQEVMLLQKSQVSFTWR